MRNFLLVFGICVPLLLGCDDDDTTSGTDGGTIDPETNVPEYYLPPVMQFISWDFPNIVHTDIDVDYKFTGYDYFNRDFSWSVVEGPEGMTIDSDGILHWTPGTEGTYSVTIALSFDGEDEQTKSFDINVDNSKCIFVAPDGSNTTGDGSIDNPFAVFGEEVAKAILAEEGGATVYNRGGEYQEVSLQWYDTSLPKMKKLAEYSFTEDNPTTIRNYPGEEPVYNISRNGFRLYGDYWILCGIEISGGTGSEAGGLVLGGRSAAKNMYVHDYNTSNKGNCTGVKVSGDAILDQVIAKDNYDRTDPEFQNSSNFLFYGTNESISGNAWFIDCLSLGYSACGFKIKHAGDKTRLHIHKCADVGTLRPWAGAQNRVTLRHSYFINANDSESGAVSLSVTDEATQGEINLDEGMLIENNLIVNASTEAVAASQWYYIMGSDPETPAYWKDNIIETSSTNNGNVFVAAMYASKPVADTWNLKFDGNKVYTTSPDNALVISGKTDDLTALFAYGEENVRITEPGSYTFTVAGKTFAVTNGKVDN